MHIISIYQYIILIFHNLSVSLPSILLSMLISFLTYLNKKIDNIINILKYKQYFYYKYYSLVSFDYSFKF